MNTTNIITGPILSGNFITCSWIETTQNPRYQLDATVLSFIVFLSSLIRPVILGINSMDRPFCFATLADSTAFFFKTCLYLVVYLKQS